MTSKKYFSDLNYSLGNEDTGFEVELLKILKPQKILSIAGCGSRLWPLVAHGAQKIIGIDVAPQQLGISELRLESIKTLTHKEYLIFWGFAPYAAYDYTFERKNLYQKLNLTVETKKYFDQWFEYNQWGSLLYAGKWEKTFSLLSKLVRAMLGRDYDAIFNHRSVESQNTFYQSEFPLKKWKAVLFLLGNKTVFDTLLYKGDFIKKNVPESHFDYYFNNFEQLFTQVRVRDSFFAHLCFHGEIKHEDGNTIEADSEVFESMKRVLNGSCQTVLEPLDLLSAAKKYENENLDFLSLSDVPSYFSGDIERNYLQELRKTLSVGGVAVVRSYLRVPEADLSGFVDITPQFAELIRCEGVQMYRIHIYQKE
jgi:S-adenosylmethionine-diacylglycerol 3-amino-3-carboxypropyl transferase